MVRHRYTPPPRTRLARYRVIASDILAVRRLADTGPVSGDRVRPKFWCVTLHLLVGAAVDMSSALDDGRGANSSCPTPHSLAVGEAVAARQVFNNGFKATGGTWQGRRVKNDTPLLGAEATRGTTNSHLLAAESGGGMRRLACLRRRTDRSYVASHILVVAAVNIRCVLEGGVEATLSCPTCTRQPSSSSAAYLVIVMTRA